MEFESTTSSNKRNAPRQNLRYARRAAGAGPCSPQGSGPFNTAQSTTVRGRQPAGNQQEKCALDVREPAFERMRYTPTRTV